MELISFKFIEQSSKSAFFEIQYKWESGIFFRKEKFAKSNIFLDKLGDGFWSLVYDLKTGGTYKFTKDNIISACILEYEKSTKK